VELSVITPTLRRPKEVTELLHCLAGTKVRPDELVLVDGAPQGEDATAEVVRELGPQMPFPIRYMRSPKGTALQRNRGIEKAEGQFIAFIDDDVRVAPDFFGVILDQFKRPENRDVGGIVGVKTNQTFDGTRRARWRWYRKLGLLHTFEPGRYDFDCGYPINAAMQAPFEGVRELDFMTTACAVWRRDVLADGLRFDLFFRNFGVLEDAHFSLRAGRTWRLLQCGDAHCRELSAAGGRGNSRLLGFKAVVNYYYVFRDIAGPLSIAQRFRFWRFQVFEIFRMLVSGIRRRRLDDLRNIAGRLHGTWHILAGFKSAKPVPRPEVES